MSTGTPYSTPEELISALYSTSSTLPGPFQELNESFLLQSAYLVFFMHCGFAMVRGPTGRLKRCPGRSSLSPLSRSLIAVTAIVIEFCCSLTQTSLWLQLSIGCVRAKFAKHIAILILVDATASALGFYLFGYPLHMETMQAQMA